MTDIEQRKRDHIEIVLSGSARHSASAGFDGIAFEHNALPELSFNEIDLSTRFLGKTLKLPFLASSMTGGPADSDSINLAIAEAAEKADHHPDILIQYSKVTLRLSTHDCNGLSSRDFALARVADELASRC